MENNCKICETPMKSDYKSGSFHICEQCHMSTFSGDWRHISPNDIESKWLAKQHEDNKNYQDKLMLAYLIKHRNEIILVEDFSGLLGYGWHYRMLMNSDKMVSVAHISRALHVMYWEIDNYKETCHEAPEYFDSLEECHDWALEHL